MRKVEVLINNLWKPISFEKIKKDDKFRMFEPSGEQVVGDKGDIEFIAESDAYINDSNVWQIDIKD